MDRKEGSTHLEQTNGVKWFGKLIPTYGSNILVETVDTESLYFSTAVYRVLRANNGFATKSGTQQAADKRSIA